MSENVSGKESRGLSPAALLVAGAFFMEFLDGTVIATALPDMAKSFGDRGGGSEYRHQRLSDHPRPY